MISPRGASAPSHEFASRATGIGAALHPSTPEKPTGGEPAFYAGGPAMKKRKQKAAKPQGARQLLRRAESWQNMTIIAHPFKPHDDPSKPYCVECGWPQGNHQ